MKHKTLRACQICGKSFHGADDFHYCPECAEKKMDTVVKIRICQDCGCEFYGGPRARRCPECVYKAQLEANRRHTKNGTKRPIGSIDKCAICGQEYTVTSGRQKYCSDACQRLGVLEWQKEHKKGYDKNAGKIIAYKINNAILNIKTPLTFYRLKTKGVLIGALNYKTQR